MDKHTHPPPDLNTENHTADYYLLNYSFTSDGDKMGKNVRVCGV